MTLLTEISNTGDKFEIQFLTMFDICMFCAYMTFCGLRVA
jgi:hypothetical protein